MSAAFLLFSGDFTRHHQNDMPSPWENVTNIVKTVTEIMGTAFPDLLAAGRFSLGTQGNDDAPGLYPSYQSASCNVVAHRCLVFRS